MTRTRVLERAALGMMEMRGEDRYVLVAIDYFARAVMTEALG